MGPYRGFERRFVQQVDSPQNLYDMPTNLFVAGFIGSPQMNFFNVQLSKENGKVYASFGENKIAVPDAIVKKFVDPAYCEKEVIMGVRPEDLSDDALAIEKFSDAIIDVNVEVVELMGSETYLYITTSGREGTFIARVDPRSLSRVGDRIKIAVDSDRLHFFDKETESTILSK
jgi:multiple sugar transport system ATP-binding protein